MYHQVGICIIIAKNLRNRDDNGAEKEINEWIAQKNLLLYQSVWRYC